VQYAAADLGRQLQTLQGRLRNLQLLTVLVQKMHQRLQTLRLPMPAAAHSLLVFAQRFEIRCTV